MAVSKSYAGYVPGIGAVHLDWVEPETEPPEPGGWLLQHPDHDEAHLTLDGRHTACGQLVFGSAARETLSMYTLMCEPCRLASLAAEAQEKGLG